MSLLNEASFLVTPNGYKEDKLYAAIPTNGNGDMTVTRATTATRVNEAGLVELVPYNLLSRSQEFNNASWSAPNATITPNATTAPDGTMTADSITSTPNVLSYFSQNTTQPAGTYTLSFFVKPQVGIGRIYLESFTASPSFHYFDLDLGVVVGSGDSTFTITPYPNGWYRCTATRTFASSILGTGAIYLAFFGSSATLTTIFFWGGQLVEGTSAKTYQKTVDRLDIPRIDYTGGGCPSILLEPLRTNLLLNSATVVTQTITTTAVANTLSFYGTGTITLSGTFAGTLVGTGASNRVSLTFTPTAGSLVLTVSGSCTNGQLEAGSYPTSYIPTVASTVTRNADVCVKTGISDLIGQTEGVMFIESAALFNDLTQRSISISDGTGNNRLIIYYNLNSNQILVWGQASGVAFPESVSYTVTDETEFAKIAVRYRANDITLWVNGEKRGTDITSQALPLSFNRFGFDSGDGGSNLFAKVKSAQLYKTYLSNDEMAALTTL